MLKIMLCLNGQLENAHWHIWEVWHVDFQICEEIYSSPQDYSSFHMFPIQDGSLGAEVVRCYHVSESTGELSK